MSAVPGLIEPVAAHRTGKSSPYVVAQNYSLQERLAVTSFAFRHGQSGGDDGASQVAAGREM